MPGFEKIDAGDADKFINERFPVDQGWQPSNKFNSKGSVYVSEGYAYTLYDKREKEYSKLVLIGRVSLGIILTLGSLFLAFGLSKSVRKLFSKKQVVRFGIAPGVTYKGGPVPVPPANQKQQAAAPAPLLPHQPTPVNPPAAKPPSAHPPVVAHQPTPSAAGQHLAIPAGAPNQIKPPIPVFNRPASRYERQVEAKHRQRLTAAHFNQSQIDEIVNRAHHLAEYVLADNTNMTVNQKYALQHELKAKLPGATQKELQDAIRGKMFSLAVKTELLFKESNVGVSLPTQVASKKVAGKMKTAPFNRLLNNTGALAFPSYVNPARKIHIIAGVQVGHGAFNDAFAVYDVTRGEVVYRALISPNTQNPQTLQQWLNETKNHYDLLRSVPGLVEIHDIIILDKVDQHTDPNRPTFVPHLRGLLLEKCEGDLNNLVKGKCSINDQIYMMAQLSTTLSYLHSHGLTHGDLKPGNVFYIGNKTKLGDLGALKRFGFRGPMEGTLVYQPPEAFLLGARANPNQYDPAIDNWALGLIIYEMKYGSDLLPRFKAITDQIELIKYAHTAGFNGSYFQAIYDYADPMKREATKKYLVQATGFSPDYVQKLCDAWHQAGLTTDVNHPLYREIKLVIDQSNDPKDPSYNIPPDQKNDYIYNRLIQYFIGNQYYNVCISIHQLLASSKDPSDVAILNLLHPNVLMRWTSAYVTNYLHQSIGTKPDVSPAVQQAQQQAVLQAQQQAVQHAQPGPYAIIATQMADWLDHYAIYRYPQDYRPGSRDEIIRAVTTARTENEFTAMIQKLVTNRLITDNSAKAIHLAFKNRLKLTQVPPQAAAVNAAAPIPQAGPFQHLVNDLKSALDFSRKKFPQGYGPDVNGQNVSINLIIHDLQTSQTRAEFFSKIDARTVRGNQPLTPGQISESSAKYIKHKFDNPTPQAKRGQKKAPGQNAPVAYVIPPNLLPYVADNRSGFPDPGPRRFDARDSVKGRLMQQFGVNATYNRNPNFPSTKSNPDPVLTQFKTDANHAIGQIRDVSQLPPSIRGDIKNTTLFMDQKRGRCQTNNKEEILGRFDVLVLPCQMEYDSNYNQKPSRNPFLMHYGAALNIGESVNASDYNDYSIGSNGPLKGPLDEDKFIADMGQIMHNMLQAQLLSGVDHNVWFPFGFGAFLRYLAKLDPSYNDPQKLERLKHRLAYEFVKQLASFPQWKSDIHLCLPIVHAESKQNFDAFMNAFSNAPQQVQQLMQQGKIHFYINRDATEIAQNLADHYGPYKVSLANGANRKLLGNHWFDDGALQAFDEGAHRRGIKAPSIALVLNNGTDTKINRDEYELRDRVNQFGGQIAVIG